MEVKVEANSSSEAEELETARKNMKVEVCKVENDIDDQIGDSIIDFGSKTSSTSSHPDSSSAGAAFGVKEESDPVYICDDCGFTAESEEDLKEHIVAFHLAAAGKKRGRKAAVETDGDDGDGDGDESAICESCGQCFAKRIDFAKHFQAEHFVVVKETEEEETLEIPATASLALRRKIESLGERMALARVEHSKTFGSHRIIQGCEQGVNLSPYYLKRFITDEMAAAIKDVGRMVRQEFPGTSHTAGRKRRQIYSYLAFRLQCGTYELKRYLSGRWNNPLQVNPVDIQAMKERLKQQVASCMPDVIANHNSKAKRLSDRTIGPVKSFNWTVSLKQSFKELVGMHLQNIRFDVDVHYNSDEKEMKAKVEEYLRKFIKTLVGIWPAGWMSERVLMNDCRSIIREFLQSLKERQSEFNDSFYGDVVVEDSEKSASPANGFERFRYAPFDVDEGSAEEPSETPSDRNPCDSSTTGSAAAATTAKIPPSFVWTKRIVRVRGYGKQSRMFLLPRGSTDGRGTPLQTPDYTSVAAKRRRTNIPKQLADERTGEEEKRKSTRARERYQQKVVDKAEIRDEIITLIS